MSGFAVLNRASFRFCSSCGCPGCSCACHTPSLLRRIVAAFDADRAGHDMRCMPELVAAIADAREVVR